jgi:hypothetical protein
LQNIITTKPLEVVAPMKQLHHRSKKTKYNGIA